MVLKHVSYHPGTVVIAGPVFHSKGLCNGNLYVVNISPVPDRFKNSISKPEHKDILHRLLCKVVVHAINLSLREITSQHRVEASGRWEIMADRLFDDYSRIS